MALGFNISVYRQQNDGSAPASFGAATGTSLARWTVDLGGLRWLDDLVKEQKAINIGETSWSITYTAMAAHVIPMIRDGHPPDAISAAPDAPVKPYLHGWTTLDKEAMDACRPDEWLVIDAQDRD